MADDVVAVLDDLGVDQADFFGYSMGGGVGYAVAKYAPARIGSYIIGGAAPYGLPDDTVRQLWSGLKGGPDTLTQFVTAEGPISVAVGSPDEGQRLRRLESLFHEPECCA
jgi:pimeloyl-ACP methyl ester carboxylesterase